MMDFFAFRKMISTSMIKVVFVLGVVSILIGAINIYGQASKISESVAEMKKENPNPREHEAFVIEMKESQVSSMKMYAVLMLIIGPILWRVMCETAIIFFVMNESLTDVRKELQIANKLNKRSSTGGQTPNQQTSAPVTNRTNRRK
jgi:hypothetical protein